LRSLEGSPLLYEGAKTMASYFRIVREEPEYPLRP
jgi:hypothetical protein